jgi:hypothetical protein
MTDRRRVFISFGGGQPNYHIRVHELCEQAQETGYFTDVLPFTEQNLMTDPSFWENHADFMLNPQNRRGFGFWLWKPYLIMKTLDQMEMGDVLIYADAGCVINPKGLDRLKEYESLLDTNEFGLIAFRLPPGNCIDLKYTKRVTLDHLGEPKLDGPTQQFMATIQIMKKTNHVVKYMKTWYDACCINNYVFLHGRPAYDEYPEYIDHRHDQSIHSLLIKRILRESYATPIELPDETWYEDGEWETKGAHVPIWAKRHKG